jgi:dTDP-glucose 4,6-dehydratase
LITSIVTGGAGFLGSHLVDELAKRGESVVVVDNLSTGRLGNLESRISSGQVTFVYADVAVDRTALRSVIAGSGAKKIDNVYHFASPAGPAAYSAHPWETLAVNGLGTMSLIDIALEYRARFIFASTSSTCGDPLIEPRTDHRLHAGSVQGRSFYDAGKRFGEAAVAAAVEKRGLDASIVRFFNCYGPRMQNSDGRLIPTLLEAIANRQPLPIQGTGQQTRSMTYVEDAIELLLIVAEQPQSSFAPIDIGSDDERSVIDIARTLAEVVRVDFVPQFVPARRGDSQRRRPDLAAARRLGWNPTTELGDGLRVTYDWFSRESQLFV